jgi:FkbM family methyltransferase
MNKKYLNLQNYAQFFVKKVLGRAATTYSQCGEDLILDYLHHHKDNGFYVDVGANDPRIFSNTYFFYKKGWNGLVIEPNLQKLDEYRSRRKRDIRGHYAVGPKGSFKFFKFREDALNTMSEEVAESYEKMGHKIVSTETVPSLPLSDIFKKKNVSRIDFLSIDTEGQNFEVLQTNDWDTYRPSFVVVETAEFDKPDDESLEEKYNTYMEQVGYKKVASTPMNSVYKNIR